MSEDPERHVSELVDCLMQSTRPIGFFMGAGCPSAIKNSTGEPLIPDIEGLTKSVECAVKTGGAEAAWDKIKVTCKEDGRDSPNIEEILDRIRGLNRYAGVGQVRGLARPELDALELAICSHIVDVAKVNLPEIDNAYQSLALWISSTARTEPVQLFTTNYDLLVEQALERGHVPFFDGFVGSCRPYFDVDSVENDELPVRWSRLWKIHGSVNWQRDVGRREIYRAKPGDGSSVVIHPSHLKYDESRKMPYLALVDRLRRFLRHGQPIMIAVGYSFRDQHINEAIAESLSSNPTGMAFGLLYGEIETYKEGQALAARCANLRLYARDRCVVGGRLFKWQDQPTEPTTALPSGILNWKAPIGEIHTWSAEVNVGDFARLGDLLYYVSQGRRTRDAIAAGSQ